MLNIIYIYIITPQEAARKNEERLKKDIAELRGQLAAAREQLVSKTQAIYIYI